LSFATRLLIEGRHQHRPPLPFVPGPEVSGDVIEVGSGVLEFKAGDRVCAGMPFGGFAEEAVAPQHNVFAIAPGVSYEAAVQFPTVFGTALAALRWRGDIKAGDTVLVLGAGSGTALAAVSVATARGARVLAAASTKDKRAAAADAGAFATFGYEEMRTEVARLTGRRGVEIAFDPIGGRLFPETLRCVAADGRLITIGFAGGSIPDVSLNLLLLKNVSICGFYWGQYLGWGKTEPAPDARERVRSVFEELSSLAQAGAIVPRAGLIVPLADFQLALAASMSRDVIGRILIKP
jgi:NADPH2:quinone reductase